MTSNILQREHNGLSVPQRKEDGYVNATAMAKAHFEGTGERKDVRNWLRTDTAKDAIEHLSQKVNISVSLLIQVKRGYGGGTWIHPRLSVRFAIWLSHDFGYLVEDWIAEWMKASYEVPHPISLAGILQDDPRQWTEHFSKDWFSQAQRVTGYEVNSYAMSHFINLTVYDRMPIEIRNRLDELNPKDENGHRAKKQHQFFTEEADDDLRRVIAEAYSAMRHSDNREDVKENLRRDDRGIYQPGLRLF